MAALALQGLKVEGPNLPPNSEITQVTFGCVLSKGNKWMWHKVLSFSWKLYGVVWLRFESASVSYTSLTEFAVMIPVKILDNLASVLVLDSACISAFLLVF